MGQFLGWASYDLWCYCPHCREEYDPDYEHEHDDCGEDENEDEQD